jgi:HEAT repeat protein
MRYWIGLSLILGIPLFAQPVPPEPPPPPRKFGFAQADRWRAEDEERIYDRARSALDARRWEQALRDFSQIAARGTKRADAALYWKAYIESRAGRREDALATLEEFRRSHSRSAWASDAKALELEIQRASGNATAPESEQDEDLKLLAMSGLMNSDPQKAMPMVVKLLDAGHSPKIRERALFVIAYSGLPQGKETVLNVARGGANPDMQRKALEYLGMMGAATELEKLYASMSDAALRRAVLRGLSAGDARDPLLRIAKSEKDPTARREVIRYLAAADFDVGQLYADEPDPGVRLEIIRRMSHQDRFDQLLELAKGEKDPTLRRAAINRLGSFDSARSGQGLLALYASESDASTKREIARSLRRSDNAGALVKLARQEKDPALRTEIVRMLADIKSPEASEYLLEILGQK